MAALSNTRVPIIAAPMFLISGPDLVVEVCLAGGVGAFPAANCRTTDDLDKWMKEITERLHAAKAAGKEVGPWAVNLVTHRTNEQLPEHLALVEKYQPPVVITALGSPKPVLETVHSYGGKVIADVININLARKAVTAGADGLACVSAGSGGHTGHLSPFAFISAVRDFFDGLLIVGGGISTGASVAGAIVAGADMVYMGTRFLATAESMAVDGYKQMVVDSGTDDVIVSNAVTGLPASWLIPSLIENEIDPFGAVIGEYNMETARSKRWRDIWGAGQGLSAITSTPTAAEVIDTIAHEYAEALQKART